ncbi:MAG: outer membrane beta-barrel protein [Proteiniphilum sp.]|jgi:hypothetical protein|nr:outer membrane beta-barrel protein [Proteiniphilum sp.]
MGADDKYIDKPDDFSRKVGEKLREHRTPVDSDVWDSLKENFSPRERSVSVYWAWAAGGVAAVVAVLLFLLNPSADEPLLTEHSQSRKQVERETEQMNPSKSMQPSESAGIARPEETTEAATVINQEETSYPATPEETPLATEKKPNQAETPSLPEKKPNPEEPVKPGTRGVPAEKFPEENNPAVPVRKQQGFRSLIAALGSGGAPLDFSFGSYEMSAPAYADSFPGGEFNDDGGVGSDDKYLLLTPGDYTYIEHHLPVSFSLTADFPIGKNISMETGLSYTYLFSRLGRNDNFIYRGTLRQHYVGIPVNLRYTIRQSEAWNIYLLGGGSIEKGLRSVYKQEIEHNGGIVHHTNLYSGINGFQFVAQGGVGFSYRLRDNLNLFGEPRLIYYFKNNQPLSARTEEPLIFGLNMGIRIEFNSNK